MERGSLVYHKDVVFDDGYKDTKAKRPCVVLFTLSDESGDYVCTSPLTSSVRSFNKHSGDFLFIPEVVYAYKKLSFVKVSNVFIRSVNDTVDTGLSLNEDVVDHLSEKIINYDYEGSNKERYSLVQGILSDILAEKRRQKRQEKREEKKMKKVWRNPNQSNMSNFS